MRTRKSILPPAIVLTILLSGLVFTPVLGMPQADLSWRTSEQMYPPPPVNTDFSYDPGNPSTYDTVRFYGYASAYDEYGNWIAIGAYAWDFGDGATATESYAEHRFDADGDYTVTFTATAQDGRTGSTTQTVMVRTHDVAITSFKVPQAAKAGQTRSITVNLGNKNYDERVRVWLYKSQPSYYWYWQEIGSSLQTVPVRKGNRGTNFDFNYTFTAEDAVVGKVNFRAYAEVYDARDALPTDNEAISDPTKVNK